MSTSNHKNYRTNRLLLNIFFVFILIILFWTTILTYRLSEKVKNAYDWVKHSNQVMHGAYTLFTDVMVAESVTRGYLVTGEDSFLLDFDEKINTIFEDLKQEQIMVQDNQNQIIVLKKLEDVLNHRIETLKASIQLKKNNALQHEDALRIIYEAQELDTNIKAIIQEFNSNESRLLQEREENFYEEFHSANLVFRGINFLTIIFLIFALVFFNRTLKNLIMFKEKSEKTESVLRGIIGGSKEYILALDLNYNFLAFNDAFVTEFRDNFGRRPVIGESLKEAISTNKEQQKKGMDLWTRALSGEEFTVIEEFGPPDHLKKYEITFSSIYNEKNELIGASHIARNIGTRLREEAELKNFNKKLEESYKAVEKQAKEMGVINEMNTALQTSISLHETLSMASLYIKKLVPECKGVIYLMNNSKNLLESGYEWDDVLMIEKTFSVDECFGLRQSKLYMFINEQSMPPCGHIEPGTGCPPYICIPLLAQNEVIGLLHLQFGDLQNKEKRIQNIVKNKQTLLQYLSGQIALSISNIKLQEFLKLRSSHDPLTNLYNRSYFNETFDRDFQRAIRNKSSLALIMMDLDQFKHINDTHGHEAGDMVLRDVSKILKSSIRETDLICRYGGEEILIVLYDATAEFAFQKSEQLRKAIADLQFHFIDLISITASFGIAMFPADGQTKEDLIRAADEALYMSKRKGRNQVTIYSPQ